MRADHDYVHDSRYLRRDLGLERVSRLTRWAVAGAAALAALFTEVAAHARPGHPTRDGHIVARAAPAARRRAAHPRRSSDGGARAPNGAAQLQPPPAPLAPTSAPPAATSGGS